MEVLLVAFGFPVHFCLCFSPTARTIWNPLRKNFSGCLLAKQTHKIILSLVHLFRLDTMNNCQKYQHITTKQKTGVASVCTCTVLYKYNGTQRTSVSTSHSNYQDISHATFCWIACLLHVHEGIAVAVPATKAMRWRPVYVSCDSWQAPWRTWRWWMWVLRPQWVMPSPDWRGRRLISSPWAMKSWLALCGKLFLARKVHVYWVSRSCYGFATLCEENN